ncbi:hypothetical protein KP509_01G100900 [Ceratopteris richardii]|uniref:Uncharacterized protein n=1 Tax=Ceratopteris richardii TaxID=49495 RepID=A0A8T2VP37_CERRI|nr:hypothetical protein KP509_01G100900 [Ceratopteris richardii]
MPRPGPRPYECVRRSWHSDTHQPLRGTLIQEIFRVVIEIHSTSTRRKKEWQEKLPIVVLRAEEILYSKANSERDYADVETLKSRLNDAVNTMIRREDSEEEGVYLVPCVEAALSLGCTPKKGPRGQRHGSSRHPSNASGWVPSVVAPVVNGDYCVGTISIVPPENENQARSTLKFGSLGERLDQERAPRFPSCESSSLLNCAGPSRAVSPCYSFASNSKTPAQSPSLIRRVGVQHSFETPLYPRQGTFVQFLRAANVNKCPVAQPVDASLFPSPCIPFNATQQFRPVNVLDGTDSINTMMHAGVLHCSSSDSLPLSRVPRLPIPGMCKDGHQYTATQFTNSLPSHGTASHRIQPIQFVKGTELHEKNLPVLSADQLRPLVSSSSLVTEHDRVASAESTNPTKLPTNEGSASLHCDYDLQLRLGPPVQKASILSVSSSSASKRIRVDSGGSSTSKNPQ